MKKSRWVIAFLCFNSLLLLLLTICCGKKADLIIPKPEIPEAVDDLKAEALCGSIKLTWTAPQYNMDGSYIEALKEFVVYRKRGAPVTDEAQLTPVPGAPHDTPVPFAETKDDSESTEFAQSPEIDESRENVTEATPIPEDTPYPPEFDFLEIGKVGWNEYIEDISPTPVPTFLPGSQESDADTNESGEKAEGDKKKKIPRIKIVFIDEGDYPEEMAEAQEEKTLPDDLLEGYAYSYQIKSVNARDKYSNPSRTVNINYFLPPAAPEGLRASVDQSSVAVNWETVRADCKGDAFDSVKGYLLYRSEKKDEFPPVPLNRKLLEETQYVDVSILMDRIYYYYITALGMNKNSISERSEILAVNTRDLFTPEPPTGFIGVPVQNGVSFLWNKSREPDIAGYNIYRKRSGEDEYEKLNDTLIEKTSFMDAAVSPGFVYSYYITAVDDSLEANESDPSAKTGITIP